MDKKRHKTSAERFTSFSLIQSIFKLLNDTVSETTVVHEVHSHELAHIDEKLDENEESLIRMNSTLEHTVGKIDDIAIHLTGLANSLDRFR